MKRLLVDNRRDFCGAMSEIDINTVATRMRAGRRSTTSSGRGVRRRPQGLDRRRRAHRRTHSRPLERKAMPPLGLLSLIRFERVGKGTTNGQGT
jgi:hypothetical protein